MSDLTTPAETAVEYANHVLTGPNGCRNWKNCIVCERHDNLHCARGRHCEAAHGNSGAHIGEWIGEDRETGHPKAESAYCFEYPTLPGVLFCEDCVGVIDDPATEPGTPVLSGTINDVHWDVFVDNGNRYRFDVTVSTGDRTGGLAWEHEVGSYATLGTADTYGRTEAERAIANIVDSEWASGVHAPEPV